MNCPTVSMTTMITVWSGAKGARRNEHACYEPTNIAHENLTSNNHFTTNTWLTPACEREHGLLQCNISLAAQTNAARIKRNQMPTEACDDITTTSLVGHGAEAQQLREACHPPNASCRQPALPNHVGTSLLVLTAQHFGHLYSAGKNWQLRFPCLTSALLHRLVTYGFRNTSMLSTLGRKRKTNKCRSTVRKLY